MYSHCPECGNHMLGIQNHPTDDDLYRLYCPGYSPSHKCNWESEYLSYTNDESYNMSKDRSRQTKLTDL